MTDKCAIQIAVCNMRARPCACGKRERAGREVEVSDVCVNRMQLPVEAAIEGLTGDAYVRVMGVGTCTICDHVQRFVSVMEDR